MEYEIERDDDDDDDDDNDAETSINNRPNKQNKDSTSRLLLLWSTMILIIGPQRYLSEIIVTQCNRILRLHALRHLDGRGTVSNKTKIK